MPPVSSSAASPSRAPRRTNGREAVRRPSGATARCTSPTATAAGNSPDPGRVAIRTRSPAGSLQPGPAVRAGHGRQPVLHGGSPWPPNGTATALDRQRRRAACPYAGSRPPGSSNANTVPINAAGPRHSRGQPGRASVGRRGRRMAQQHAQPRGSARGERGGRGRARARCSAPRATIPLPSQQVAIAPDGTVLVAWVAGAANNRISLRAISPAGVLGAKETVASSADLSGPQLGGGCSRPCLPRLVRCATTGSFVCACVSPNGAYGPDRAGRAQRPATRARPRWA